MLLRIFREAVVYLFERYIAITYVGVHEDVHGILGKGTGTTCSGHCEVNWYVYTCVITWAATNPWTSLPATIPSFIVNVCKNSF